MKNVDKKTGRLLIMLGLLTLLMSLPFDTAFAQSYTNLYQGRYACRIDSDGTFEHAVILLLPNGKNPGKFLAGSTKTLMSDSFYCSDGRACQCVYSLASTSSYILNPNGTGSATMNWVHDPSNDAACPSADQVAYNFTDNWVFVLSSNASVQQVTSDNNGNTNASGSGTCNRVP